MSERWARTILTAYRLTGAIAYPFIGTYVAWRTAKGKEQYSGLVFFALQDEWWKSAKRTVEETLRQDADDPEQWFGVYSVDTQHRLTPKGAIPETIRQLFAEP